MKKGLIIGASIAALALAYAAATPYIAIHGMKSALEARDGQALAEYIDFPAVRQSAKEQFNAAALEKIATEDASGLEAVGAALASTMIDKMVDAAVTPAGLTKLIESGEKKGVIGSSRLANATSSYENWNKFVVTTDGAAKDQGKFILRRQGLLGWKLTEFIIPSSIFAPDPQSSPDAAAAAADAAAAAADADAAIAEANAVEMGTLAPPEPSAQATTTPANFSPLLAPQSIVTQGRCHMGECDWVKWLSATEKSRTRDETVLIFSVLGGASVHEEAEDYPSSPDGVAIKWNSDPHDVKIRCSHTRPSVSSADDAADAVIHMNPETGVYGYQEGSAAMYFVACHNDTTPYPRAIEKYGYHVES